MSRLEDYMKENRKVGCFGIQYLDDKLRGILKGDLILIGARSGAGKSTIAEIIATANSSQGKKVTLLSLENFKDDNFVQKAYYKYKAVSREWSLSQRDFSSGDFKPNLYALKEAEKYAEQQFENINLINRQANFGKEELKEAMINAVQNEKSDLVIIDHIDYLDKEPNQTEVEHVTSIMKEIRAAQYAFKMPVIAISHLRKTNSKYDIKVPSIDEFIGSSNKVKEATCVIMFAPNDEENMQMDGTLKATFCCIRKLRMGGIDNTVAKIYFDTRTGQYKDGYNVYRVDYSGTKISS